MSWTVITVTHNSASTLERFWSGGIPAGIEWIVVDNASTDDSLQVAARLGARVIGMPTNRGFSAANNRALEEVTTDLVAFVNPDVSVDWASLDVLGRTAEESGALVAPQLLNEDGSQQPNGRGLPYLVDKLAHRGITLPGSRVGAYLPVAVDGPTPVAWVMGAALGGRRDLFRALGGWDDGYFIYYEDHEIGLRAWSRGIPVLLDPRARWVHGWARDTSGANRSAWTHELKSAARFYLRYPELLLPWRALARRREYSRRMTQWPQQRD